MLEVGLFGDLKSSFVGRYVHKNGSSYEGEIKDGLMHGKGKLTVYREGGYEVHEGTFREGFLEKGIKTIVDKESTMIIEGNFKNKELDGFGKEAIENSDGERCELEGNYKNGKLNGIGKTMYIKKDLDDEDMYVKIVYTGEFKDGNRHGKGKMVKIDTWRDTKKSCEGTFVNGYPNGLCVIKDDEEEYTYKGEVKDGLPHGKGVKNYFYGEVEKGYFEFGELKNNAKLF